MDKYNYTDIAAWVEQQMRNKESDDIEFKSAAGGFPGSFWETYSSFANTYGGTIVLGVKERHNIFIPDDLTEEQIEKYEKEFWRNVNNPEKVNRNLLSNDDVKRVILDGHHILLFYIPRASRELRPIHCTHNHDNGTYKRNHEGDFKCTPLEVRRMFADANIDTPADSRILDGYSIDDIDTVSLSQYRRLFDLAKPGHAWLAQDDMGLLKKLGAYRTDRKTG
ncbi:MAG: ATP-binding protein, partial [Prevotellaceae bacterium]|nr:ATP-binding protein [Prevotellaceae bacterium]